MGLSILNRLRNFHFRDVYIVFDINSFETNQNWFTWHDGNGWQKECLKYLLWNLIIMSAYRALFPRIRRGWVKSLPV